MALLATQPRRIRTRLRPRLPRTRRGIAATVLATLLCLSGAEAAAAWRGSNWAMYLPQVTYAWDLQSYPALARVATPIVVHSSTGATLTGRFFRGRLGATIILSHGCAGNQDEMLPVANMLHAAGFNVVTYNERGRGTSTGQITLGALETKDLRSVVDVVSRHAYVDPNRIGALGFSMGAGFTILEAAADPRVKAVVDVAGWAVAEHWLDPKLSDLWKRPTTMYSPLSLLLVQLRTGINISSLRPQDVIAKLSPRPVFIIQGLDDKNVSPNESRANYAHARGPKTLWLVKGANHYGMVGPTGAVTTSPRVAEFFAHALLGAR